MAPAVAADFTLSDNTALTIAAGSTTSTGEVTITAVDNDVDAPDKSVTVSATAASTQVVTAPSSVTLTITDDEGPDGAALYVSNNCGSCHDSGVQSAPRLSDRSNWETRLGARMIAGLYASAIDGRGNMPARGGRGANVTDAELRAIVDYMVATATNNPPAVATALADQAAMVGTAFSFQFAEDAFSDADNDTLSYVAVQSDDSTLPAWLSFTESTRTFSGTPAATDVGTVSVKVTASDGNGGSVSDSFDIVVSADTTAPAFSSASVDGATLTLTFNEDLDTSGTAPATGAFTVSGTAETTSVTAVAFHDTDATKVALTLSPAVGHGESGITVGYTEPTGAGTHPLADAAGNKVETFSGQTVTNDTPDMTAPTLSTAAVDGATLTLTYDEALDTASEPASSAFTVKVGGTGVSLAASGAVDIDGKAVTLTLASAVLYGPG